MVLRRCRTEDGGLVEAVEHDGRRAGGQGPEEAGAEPVDVEQRQAQDQPVRGSPPPGRVQRRDARQQRPVGVHGALGPPGGARGVDDQGVVARLQLGRGRRCAPGLPGQLVHAHDGDAGTEEIGAHPAPGRWRARAGRRPRRGPPRRRGPTGSPAPGPRRPGARPRGPRRTREWHAPATAPGPPDRPRARRGPTPPGRSAGRARRRRPTRPPPVDEHRRVRAGGPPARPHLGQRPPRQGARVGPAPRGDERPHRPRPQVIVWRS